MSDWFATLAARALPADGGVQPRPRVRFEPAAREQRDALPPRMARGAAGLDDVAPRTQEPLAAVAEARAADVPSHTVPTLAEESAPPPTASPLPAASRPDPTVRDVALADGDARDPVVLVPPTRPAPPALAPQERGAAPAATSTPLRARRSSPALPGRAPAASAGDAGTDAAPTIRIHIGRVEVRAAPAPAAPPAPAKSATRGLMSLEEYVRQRRGEQP